MLKLKLREKFQTKCKNILYRYDNYIRCWYRHRQRDQWDMSPKTDPGISTYLVHEPVAFQNSGDKLYNKLLRKVTLHLGEN